MNQLLAAKNLILSHPNEPIPTNLVLGLINGTTSLITKIVKIVDVSDLYGKVDTIQTESKAAAWG